MEATSSRTARKVIKKLIDASNILKGTDVWLNGQRVGTVTSVAFAPASAPPEARVVIATDLLMQVQSHVRLDSRASLQSGGTIIGAPVVYLTSGTPMQRGVLPGDTIRGVGKSDFEIWLYAFNNDQVVVTINAKDFLNLAAGAESLLRLCERFFCALNHCGHASVDIENLSVHKGRGVAA